MADETKKAADVASDQEAVEAAVEKSTAPDDASAQEKFQTGARVVETERLEAAAEGEESVDEAHNEGSAQDEAKAYDEAAGVETHVGIDGENPVSFWNPSPKALAQHERRLLRPDEGAERDDADSRSEAAKATRTRNAKAATPATPAKKA